MQLITEASTERLLNCNKLFASQKDTASAVSFFLSVSKIIRKKTSARDKTHADVWHYKRIVKVVCSLFH